MNQDILSVNASLALIHIPSPSLHFHFPNKTKGKERGCRRTTSSLSTLSSSYLLFYYYTFPSSLPFDVSSHLISSILPTQSQISFHSKKPSQTKPNPNTMTPHTKEEENSGIRVQIPSPTQESVRPIGSSSALRQENTSIISVHILSSKTSTTCMYPIPLHFLALNRAREGHHSSSVTLSTSTLALLVFFPNFNLLNLFLTLPTRLPTELAVPVPVPAPLLFAVVGR
jgi:hypothetical protein